jgi:hypothetical protein
MQRHQDDYPTAGGKEGSADIGIEYTSSNQPSKLPV